jgi:hypothetical protein
MIERFFPSLSACFIFKVNEQILVNSGIGEATSRVVRQISFVLKTSWVTKYVNVELETSISEISSAPSSDINPSDKDE